MKPPKMNWTSAAGDNYAVTSKNEYYELRINGHFQQTIKKESLLIEEAARILVNKYNDECEAERQYFKNNPSLNP